MMMERLDLDGQRRAMDLMVDQGSDAICILANFSEQFVMTDEERRLTTEASLKQVDGRVPVIVTCSHFSTQIAAARAKHAADHGAAMLMLMPPYHGAALQADEGAMIEHFAAVAKAIGSADHGAGCATCRVSSFPCLSWCGWHRKCRWFPISKLKWPLQRKNCVT